MKEKYYICDQFGEIAVMQPFDSYEAAEERAEEINSEAYLSEDFRILSDEELDEMEV